MKFLFLVCLLPLTSVAQDLKVMTWNTFLIPPPWNSTKQTERVEAMEELLPNMDQDVIFFQEAFYNSKRNKLIESLKKTHLYSVVPKSGKKLKHIQDSGLFMASKYAMKILGQVIFKNCARADCMSSKSAILVEIEMPSGKKVQLMNTHLQAWDTPKIVAIRRKQLQQIKHILATHLRPGIPQVLIGDLNIDGKVEPEYSSSLKLLEMTSTPLEGSLMASSGFSTKGCFKKPGMNKEEWLDHMWLKTNGTQTKITSKKVVTMVGELASGLCPLSQRGFGSY
jgi:endonuclease/exonuclease/phosphatase family metal-dependent hydrolase